MLSKEVKKNKILINLISMFKYLFKYLNFFFNKKISFKFSNPQKKEIVLFDGESHPHLKKLLSIYDYKIIDNRPSRINEVYCSLNFIINFIINIFLLFRKNKNLQTTYFYTLIKNDLYSEDISVFSPNGDAYTLPRGAVVLDFAYAVSGFNSSSSFLGNSDASPYTLQLDANT